MYAYLKTLKMKGLSNRKKQDRWLKKSKSAVDVETET